MLVKIKNIKGDLRQENADRNSKDWGFWIFFGLSTILIYDDKFVLTFEASE